jgi:hypothetical protein
VERALAAGGVAHTQARRHALGQRHAPRHLQPWLRVQALGFRVISTSVQSTYSSPLGFQVRVSAEGEREDNIFSERLELANV